MDVRVKFLGGAKTVTGSKYFLEIDDRNILVDCGLFQGKKELRLRNWDTLPVDVSKIHTIILTHAHIDHSGYLPKIVKDGFQGQIFCTHATKELIKILLLDSARLQEEEAEFARKKGYSRHKNPLPLYTVNDVEQVLPLINSISFEQPFSLTEDISVEFLNAGHILGSAIVNLYLKGEKQKKKITFSGDLGRQNDPILYPPSVITETDILFIESTYGNKEVLTDNIDEVLSELINNEVMDKGCLLIPAFSVGRTQNVLFYLISLMEKGTIPFIPIYIDSPMAISVTGLYKEYKSDLKLKDSFFRQCLFDHPNVHYIQESSGSRALNDISKNAIIISASGMCTGGRILHHLYHRLIRENDTLLFVGYQGEETRGDRILKGEETVKIFGQEVSVKCNVKRITGLSAHANKLELLQWANKIEGQPKYTFIIHGEKEAAVELQQTLIPVFGNNVIVPEYLESFSLFEGI